MVYVLRLLGLGAASCGVVARPKSVLVALGIADQSIAATFVPDAEIFTWTLKINFFSAVVSESLVHVRIHGARVLKQKQELQFKHKLHLVSDSRFWVGALGPRRNGKVPYKYLSI